MSIVSPARFMVFRIERNHQKDCRLMEKLGNWHEACEAGHLAASGLLCPDQGCVGWGDTYTYTIPILFLPVFIFFE